MNKNHINIESQYDFFENLFEPIIIIRNNKIIFANKQAYSEFSCNDGNDIKIFFNVNFLENETNNIFLNDLFSNGLQLERKTLLKIYDNINYYTIKLIKIDNETVMISFKFSSDKLTKVMYDIAKSVNLSNNLDSLFQEIHKNISTLIDATNFFIALYDEINNIITFPYFQDEKDDKFTILDASDSGSLTAEVIRSGQPILITKDEMLEKYSDDQESWGTLSEVWLGVPLRIGSKIIGAFALQSYNNVHLYTIDDLEILLPLSEQISIAVGKKIAEDEIRNSEKKFKLAFETSPDAIAINRMKDGLYVEINDGFTGLTGYTKSDVIGKSSYEINIWFDFSDRDKLVKGLMKEGFYKNLEAKFRLKNNKTKYALMSANVILLNNELHILSITRDIDELKKARTEVEKLNIELEQRVLERTSQYHDALEELRSEIDKRKSIQIELEKYQSELAEALANEKKSNTLKSRFISMVSHEYRTPLTIIYTSSELIEKFYETKDEEKHKRHLERIKLSVNNMTQLLDDVLFIGKADHHDIKVSKEIINITEFIFTIVEEMKILAQDAHEFNFEYSDEEIWIESDKRILAQILTNLISNAIKYSKIGSPIDIDLIDNNTYFQLNISDYGIGIPREDSEMIYEHFYRGVNVGTISGTGLGLAIVKRCVDSLKGNISFTTEPNVGTSFYIKIPKKIE